MILADKVEELINRQIDNAKTITQYRKPLIGFASVKNCPTGALTIEGLDKQRCYTRLLEVDKLFPDLGLCDICGKCSVGPCASL